MGNMINIIRMIKMTKMIKMIKIIKVIKVIELIKFILGIKMTFCIDDKYVKDEKDDKDNNNVDNDYDDNDYEFNDVIEHPVKLDIDKTDQSNEVDDNKPDIQSLICPLGQGQEKLLWGRFNLTTDFLIIFSRISFAAPISSPVHTSMVVSTATIL